MGLRVFKNRMGAVDWIHLAQDRDQSSEDGNEPSGITKYWEIV
jgi:hypothetical protein